VLGAEGLPNDTQDTHQRYQGPQQEISQVPTDYCVAC
jgi:hypothetical protein